MPIAAYQEVTNYWGLGNIVCDIWTSCDVLCCTASILHLVAIALDRYWAISNVNYGSKRTNFRIISMILLIWLLSAVISILPHIFGLSFLDDKSKKQHCQLTDNFIYQIFSTLGAFYLPLIVMCIIYWKIFQVAKFRIRKKAFQRPNLDTLKTYTTQNVDAVELIKDKLSSLQESNRSRSINSSNNNNDNNSPRNVNDNDKKVSASQSERECINKTNDNNINKKYSIIVKLTNTRRSFREILSKKRAIFKSILYFNKSVENQKMIRNEQNRLKLEKLDEKYEIISQLSFKTKESDNDDYNEFESYSLVDINKVIDDQNLTLDNMRKALNQGIEIDRIHLKDDKSTTTIVPIAIPESYDTQSLNDTLINIKYLADARKLKHSLSNQLFHLDQNYKKKQFIRPSKSFDIEIYTNNLSKIESEDDETKEQLYFKDVNFQIEKSNIKTGEFEQTNLLNKRTEDISLLGDMNASINNYNSLKKLSSNESIMISPTHQTQNFNKKLNSSINSGSSLTKPSNEATNGKANTLKKRNKIDIKRERKAAKTLGIIMSCFILCWLPFFIMQIINSVCKECAMFLNNYPIVTILTWLGYMNSLLNPIIYTIFSPDFRQAFAKILFGKCRKRKKKMFSFK
jgi:hypothetical protein